eukprot:COSAG01_NODE_42550_length_439_cov_0.414706_1_plen_85_part_01
MTSELEKTKAELEAVRQQLTTAVAERDELRERLALLEATVQQQREGIMTEVKQGVLAAVRNEIDQLKEDFAVENSQLASRLDEVV